MAEVTEAFKWLADRGFGQAPKTVQIEGSVTTGFKMVFRKWAPGTDPATLPLSEMPKSIACLGRLENGRRAGAKLRGRPVQRRVVRAQFRATSG